MFHVALFEPEIPPNTGNVMRLCANTGAQLHLIGALGFTLDDRRMRRAGLDYREQAVVQRHASFPGFCEAVGHARVLACSTRAGRVYSDVSFAPGDVLLFGPETRGLPSALLEAVPGEQRLRIPMGGGSRSLNLSNAVAVVLYEAWRQHGFAGGR